MYLISLYPQQPYFYFSHLYKYSRILNYLYYLEQYSFIFRKRLYIYMDSLILGLDPGSTIGYAILNLNGELIKIESLRNSSIDKTISKVNELGKIVIIGTDVSPVPKFVDKVASNLGAEVIEPNESLLLKYKNKVTKEFLKDKNIKIKNKHELDALAAALIAFKHYQPLFNRIDNHLNKINKNYLNNKIKNTVLTKKISIKNAIEKYG